jgi:streptogramin lyase
VYVADESNHKVRKVTPAGVVTTIAGSGFAGSSDGTGSLASFYFPAAVAVDTAGNIYVSDFNNNKIRKVTPAGVVTTLAGNGTVGSDDGMGSSATSFNGPYGIAAAGSGTLYVADVWNHKIRKIVQP